MKLNGTYQLLVYSDVRILGGSVHTIKKAASLVVASKENRLEVNADKTQYMVMSWDRNAGQSHNIKNDNISFERVEEMKSRLKSGNASYYSVQNVLSSSLLSKNLKIKIYRTIILPVVLYWMWNLVAYIEGGM